MQVPVFDPKKEYPQFAQLIHAVPQAEKLHHRVSAAVIGYLRQLNGIIPDITDNLGLKMLTFDNFHFEIINSASNDKTKHQVAINFISTPLWWIDTVGDYLLLSKPSSPERTFLLKLQPFISIHTCQHGNHNNLG